VAHRKAGTDGTNRGRGTLTKTGDAGRGKAQVVEKKDRKGEIPVAWGRGRTKKNQGKRNPPGRSNTLGIRGPKKKTEQQGKKWDRAKRYVIQQRQARRGALNSGGGGTRKPSRHNRQERMDAASGAKSGPTYF